MADFRLYCWAPKQVLNHYEITDRTSMYIVLRRVSEVVLENVRSCVNIHEGPGSKGKTGGKVRRSPSSYFFVYIMGLAIGTEEGGGNMRLKQLTHVRLIEVGAPWKTKEDVIRHLIDRLHREGKISSPERFTQAVMERESQSPTGLEGGFAIPHGKSPAVRSAAFAVAKLAEPIRDWESLDPDNEVDLVFLLAIPEEEAGSTHLDLLAELAKRMARAEFRKRLQGCTTAEELYRALDDDGESAEEERDGVAGTKTLVEVTACPAGIAHTYMAAESLEQAGRKLGVAVYVEKQGANGIEDPHTEERLKAADAAIFAADVSVKGEERFAHLPVYRTSVAAPLRNAEEVIRRALEQAEKEGKENPQATDALVHSPQTSWQGEVKNAILTGLSHIIPIIIAGGMILASAVLIAQIFGLQQVYETENSWLWLLRKLGGNLLGMLMIPVLSAYMAYALADKPALGPGFAAGIAATMIEGGFLGGMLGGFHGRLFHEMAQKTASAEGGFLGVHQLLAVSGDRFPRDGFADAVRGRQAGGGVEPSAPAMAGGIVRRQRHFARSHPGDHGVL